MLFPMIPISSVPTILAIVESQVALWSPFVERFYCILPYYCVYWNMLAYVAYILEHALSIACTSHGAFPYTHALGHLKGV